MKKFILMFALLCGISAFAAPNFQLPEQFRGKYHKATLSVAELDELLAANTQVSKYDSNLHIIHILKKLAGKDLSKLTYSEVKTLVSDVYTELGCDEAKNALCNIIVAKVITLIYPLNHLVQDAFKDTPVKETSYFISQYFCSNRAKLPVTEWRSNALKYFDKTSKNLNMVNNFVKTYQMNMKYFSNDQIKEDLTYVKKLIYPNIANSDAWKDPNVKVELMLKAIQ